MLLGLSFPFCSSPFPALAADKTRLRVDDYQIDAELSPHVHKITAHAKVRFTALEDLNIATFELHNDLRVTKVVDANGKPLNAERVSQDSTVRVQLPNTLPKDASTTLTFDYEGILESADDSPVQGLKLAYIGDDTQLSALRRPLGVFPVNAYGLNRFTATINITLPAHLVVIAADPVQSLAIPRPRKRWLERYLPKLTVLFGTSPASPAPSWPEFFRNTKAMSGALISHSSSSRPTRTGMPRTLPPPSKNSFITSPCMVLRLLTTLKVVEIPDDTVPAAWAPEMAASRQPGGDRKSELPVDGEYHRAPVVGCERQPRPHVTIGG